MSDDPSIRQIPAPSSARSGRRGRPISLVLLHSSGLTPAGAADRYAAEDSEMAPHYHIGADGTVTQLVAERLAARHSGLAKWRGRRVNVDKISIGIALEHTAGAPYPAALLRSLHRLIAALRRRHAMPEDALYRWEPDLEGRELGPGALLPAALPPLPPPLPATLSDPAADLGGQGLDDGDVTCAPPPLPPDERGPLVLGDGAPAPDPAALWRFLQQETYRQRGEGFHPEWALHQYAVRKGLGAPLARSSGEATHVAAGGKRYLFQPFARDTAYNEIPLWSNLQSLGAGIAGAIPAGGLLRQLLESQYGALGNPLHGDWAFHQAAVREQLGPPLSGSYRITVDGHEYSLQVFAGDTLYSPVPRWSEVRRLSQTPPGSVREALWAETYKPSGAAYSPGSPFQALAADLSLGAPLSGPFQAAFEGASYTVQVFAYDTLYAAFDGAPGKLSELPAPADFAPAPATPRPQPQLQAQPQPAPSGDPGDALGERRPVFALLPLPGEPDISQFYGYTRFAASAKGRELYARCQHRHSGIDFAVPVGTPLLAIAHGVVVHAGADGPFGAKLPLSIVVRYGAIYALYGHASEVQVARGQRVAPGDVLGRSGSFNGPHLHFELRAVPPQAIRSQDPHQAAVNPGRTFNPVDCFSPTLDGYFQRKLQRLGNGDGGFCCGGFRDQAEIVFGGPPDTRPCG